MKTKAFWSLFAGVVLPLALVGCNLPQPTNPTLTPTSESPATTALPPSMANRNPVLAGIQSPGEGSSFSLNSTIPVIVSFDSQKPVQLVQVYLDGQAIDSIVPDPQAQVATLQIPGAALQGKGLHTLMVMTFDSDGRGALSNVVHLYGVPAEQLAYTLIAKKGVSLQAFAEEIQVSLDVLLAANPDLAEVGITSGAQTLPADTTLVVPFGLPPASQPYSGKAPGQVQYAQGMPTPPSATVQADGCDVQVSVSGQEGQPSGYNLYRLDLDSAQFVLVAYAPPGRGGSAVFADKSMSGPTQYMVSAYNHNGETFSTPVMALPTDPECNPVQAGLPVSNGILSLPTDVQSVYFYMAVNDGEYDRWPAKQGEFLSPSNGTIDLLSMMKSRPDLNLTYPLYVDLEAWGWKAGELLYLGKAYAGLDEADLKICGLGDCSGEASINYVYTTSIGDEKNASRKLKWWTSLPMINTVLFQLSTSPFPSGYQAEPPGLVYSQLKSGSGGNGHFVVDFANLPLSSQMNIPGDYGVPVQPTKTIDPSQPGWTGMDWFNSRLEKVGQNPWQSLDLNAIQMTPGASLPVERKFYARFIPMDGGQPAGPVSNTVVIDYLPNADNSQITIETIIPSIYDVHIEQDQFTPPIPPDPNLGWGCVDVLGVNPSAMAWTDPEGPWQYARGIWQYHLDNHIPICPTPYDPDANKSLGEKLWDYVSDGIGIVNQAFHYAKDAVIGPFEAGLQLLSLGNCGTSCHQWLHVGLDIALAAYGIPPEIPDLNKLTDQGIEYIVDEGLKQIQLDGACSVVPKCREELTKMLKNLKNQFNLQITNTYQNEAIAHAHGVNPLAIPYGDAVTVQPAAAANWQMPTALVTITRKPGTENVSDAELMYKYDYRLNVWIHAQNDTCVGQKHGYPTASCSTNGGVAYGCQEVVETLDKPCDGTLFFGRIRVPILQPGESRQVKVILMPQPYYLPVPLEYQVYQSISSNDFTYLYVGADTTIQASLIGSIQDGPWPFEMSIASDGPYPLTLPPDLESVH